MRWLRSTAFDFRRFLIPVGRGLVLFFLLWSLRESFVWLANSFHDPNDLGAFLHAGRAYRLGLNPYQAYPFIEPARAGGLGLNLNPPLSVYAFAGLSRLGNAGARDLMIAANLGLFTVSCWLLLCDYPGRRGILLILAIAASAGLWHALVLQQVYGLLLLLLVIWWQARRDGHELIAALSLGFLVALKPQIGLLPVGLLLAGHRRAGAAPLLAALLMSSLPVVIDGPGIYREWIHAVRGADPLIHGDLSYVALMSRLGAPGLARAAGLAGLAVFLGWAAMARPAPLMTASMAIFVLLLAGTTVWAGYALLALPILLSRRLTPVGWTGLLLLCFPVNYYVTARDGDLFNQLLFGGIYVWALLVLASDQFAVWLSARQLVVSTVEPVRSTRAALP